MAAYPPSSMSGCGCWTACAVSVWRQPGADGSLVERPGCAGAVPVKVEQEPGRRPAARRRRRHDGTPTPEAKKRGAVGDDLPRLVVIRCALLQLRSG